MNSIQTPLGEIAYEKIGSGAPLVVLHGGPGCESSYMLAGLKPLAQWRTLYFFDQYGCGEDRNDPENADYKKTVEHALSFVRSLKLDTPELGLLGHSFGAHMAFGMMEHLGKLRELVFLNPVPPTAELWRRIHVNLSAADAARIEKLTPMKTREAGVEIINIFSRIYCEEWPPTVQF